MPATPSIEAIRPEPAEQEIEFDFFIISSLNGIRILDHERVAIAYILAVYS
jgi:hypothetical protein